MALRPVYLVSAKNLGRFLESLRNAQAPEKFAVRFVEDLGFRSTNDRLFIPLLKAMRFLDDAGKPTARYHAFLDETRWKQVLAEGIHDAYSDLFRINRSAQTLSREHLMGKIKSLGEGKLSDAVLEKTVKTFIELAKLANFAPIDKDDGRTTDDGKGSADESTTAADTPLQTEPMDPRVAPPSHGGQGLGLVYRIEIVLPAVRDQAIYDAIFRSLRTHLLR